MSEPLFTAINVDKQDMGQPISPRVTDAAQTKRARRVAPLQHQSSAAQKPKSVKTIGVRKNKPSGCPWRTTLGMSLNKGQ